MPKTKYCDSCRKRIKTLDLRILKDENSLVILRNRNPNLKSSSQVCSKCRYIVSSHLKKQKSDPGKNDQSHQSESTPSSISCCTTHDEAKRICCHQNESACSSTLKDSMLNSTDSVSSESGAYSNIVEAQQSEHKIPSNIMSSSKSIELNIDRCISSHTKCIVCKKKNKQSG